MKKLLLSSMLVLSLTLPAAAAKLSIYNMLAPNVNWLQMTNTTGVTNMYSTTKYGGAMTNATYVGYSLAASPGTMWWVVTTNVTTDTTGGSMTAYSNVVASAPMTWGAGNVFSNIFNGYTTSWGVPTNLVAVSSNVYRINPIYKSDVNLLGQVVFPSEAGGVVQGYATATTTNAIGTLSITTLGVAAGSLVAVVVPLFGDPSMDAVDPMSPTPGSPLWESTLAADAVTVTATTAAGYRTMTAEIPNLWAGARGLRLQSLNVTGSTTPVMVVDVSFSCVTQ